MSTRKVRRRPKAPKGHARLLEQRLEDERRRLFKAASIVACCRLACASMLQPPDDREVMSYALQAAHDLIDATASELEVIGSAAGDGYDALDVALREVRQ